MLLLMSLIRRILKYCLFLNDKEDKFLLGSVSCELIAEIRLGSEAELEFFEKFGKRERLGRRNGYGEKSGRLIP